MLVFDWGEKSSRNLHFVPTSHHIHPFNYLIHHTFFQEIELKLYKYNYYYFQNVFNTTDLSFVLNVMQLTAIMPGPRQKRENLENILPPRIFCACCFEFYFPLFFHTFLTYLSIGT